MSDVAGEPEARAVPRTWEVLLDVDGCHVLEVSGDDGARAKAIEARGARVTVWATGERAITLRGRGLTVAEAPGQFDAVVADLAMAPSAESWPCADLTAFLTSLGHCLRPGGALVAHVHNPLYRLPGLGPLRAMVGGPTPLASPPTAASVDWRWLDLTRLELAITAARLDHGDVFVALPTALAPKFLVPLGEPAILRHFFRHLVPRPAAASRRLLVTVAAMVAATGALAFVVPAWEVHAVRSAHAVRS